MLSHYFNMGSIRNMSVSLTGYRYEYDNRADKGMYISLSMPWGDNSTVSYNGKLWQWDGQQSGRLFQPYR
ncbi:fimbrial outer membrane usher protein StfC [Escherichia coli]|uniref:Fimbrial outer membrane usher protein StfC n=1 Tax=Escherichia coli TaxID=562 RepID=A0A377BSM0_ECOLX|nr:fimbrial outer membrane usher protein StfC [Escherichia coli]